MTSKSIFNVLILLALTIVSVLLIRTKLSDHKQVSAKKDAVFFGQLNPNAPHETIQFGQLVGQWDCTSYDLQQDSTWYKSKAEWIFKYTLDGYAIEDTWIERTSDSTNNTTLLGRDFHGINMRLFNPNLKKWQCVWLDNRQNTISPIWQASYNDSTKELVMHDESLKWKIIFFNINETNFDWNYKVLQDSTWTIVSRIKGVKVH